MSNKYFILWYRLHKLDSYLIWYSNNIAGVIVDKNSYVPSFTNFSSLQSHAKNNRITLEEESPILYNLNEVKNWLKNRKNFNINCRELLAAWNLFKDLAVSVQDTSFDCQPQLTHNIYNKLFWGNNLPAVTPVGKHYEPIWTDKEVEILHKILTDGLLLFQSRVAHRPYNNGGDSLL